MLNSDDLVYLRSSFSSLSAVSSSSSSSSDDSAELQSSYIKRCDPSRSSLANNKKLDPSMRILRLNQ